MMRVNLDCIDFIFLYFKMVEDNKEVKSKKLKFVLKREEPKWSTIKDKDRVN